MSWGNFGNNRGGNYARGGQRSSGRSDYDRGGFQRQEGKKHSGASMTIIKSENSKYKGQMCVTAWNWSRKRGMVTLAAFPYYGTHETRQSASGKVYIVMMGRMQFKDSGVEKHEVVLVEKSTGQFTFRSEGILVRPKTNYCGHY